MKTRLALVGALTLTEMHLLRKPNITAAVLLGAAAFASADLIDRKILCYCP